MASLALKNTGFDRVMFTLLAGLMVAVFVGILASS